MYCIYFMLMQNSSSVPGVVFMLQSSMNIIYLCLRILIWSTREAKVSVWCVIRPRKRCDSWKGTESRGCALAEKFCIIPPR